MKYNTDSSFKEATLPNYFKNLKYVAAEENGNIYLAWSSTTLCDSLYKYTPSGGWSVIEQPSSTSAEGFPSGKNFKQYVGISIGFGTNGKL